MKAITIVSALLGLAVATPQYQQRGYEGGGSVVFSNYGDNNRGYGGDDGGYGGSVEQVAYADAGTTYSDDAGYGDDGGYGGATYTTNYNAGSSYRDEGAYSGGYSGGQQYVSDGGYGGGYGGERYSDARYKYAYEVKDTPTYNYQRKEESRYGKQLKGKYSWVGPDAYLYTVTYYDNGYGIRMNVQKTRQGIFPGWQGNYGYARTGGYGGGNSYARAPAYVAAPAYAGDGDSYEKKA